MEHITSKWLWFYLHLAPACLQSISSHGAIRVLTYTKHYRVKYMTYYLTFCALAKAWMIILLQKAAAAAHCPHIPQATSVDSPLLAWLSLAWLTSCHSCVCKHSYCKNKLVASFVLICLTLYNSSFTFNWYTTFLDLDQMVNLPVVVVWNDRTKTLKSCTCTSVPGRSIICDNTLAYAVLSDSEQSQTGR